MSRRLAETFKRTGGAAKLPKQTREASPAFSYFAIAARVRISEKNPAFPPRKSIQIADLVNDVRCSAGGDSRHRRRRHGVLARLLHRPSVAGGALLQPRRGQFLEELCDPDSVRRDPRDCRD